MFVRFWGTRGSIPQARPGVMRYGGNTSCIEVRSKRGSLVVIDCGTGSFALGRALMAQPDPVQGTLLFSHTHWDHIQGFPFFQPLFAPKNSWSIYGPQGLNSSLRDTLSGQMQYDYFPITLDAMGSQPRYHDLVEGVFELDDITVHTHYLDHPALTLGYRLEVDDAVLVYACDHEPISRCPDPGERELAEHERAHVEFLRDADLVIHDAQFSVEEYPSKLGWGHSTPDYAVAVAHAAGAKRLALTHHDPDRDDYQVDVMISKIRNKVTGSGFDLDVFAAAEGMSLELEGRPGAVHKAQPKADATQERSAHHVPQLVVGPLRSEAIQLIEEAARNEGVELLAIDRIDELAHMSDPIVLVLDATTSQDLLRQLMGMMQVSEAGMPCLVMIDDCQSDYPSSTLPIQGWMTWPFTLQYAQTAIKAWALRQECNWQPAAIPRFENERLQSLLGLNILDTEREDRFDRLTKLASQALNLPLCMITFIDADRQWIKSSQGVEIHETPRENAFCAHTILQDSFLEVPDTLADPRFADNPVVANEPYIRFYAGWPLRVGGGGAIGSICVLDLRPRQLSLRERQVLQSCAQLVEVELIKGRRTHL